MGLRETCGNCGATLETQFKKLFFSKHQQCPSCMNPTLVQLRSEELKEEIAEGKIEEPVEEVKEEGVDILVAGVLHSQTEETLPPSEPVIEEVIVTDEVEMETITIKLSENPAIAEVYAKENIEHDGDEVTITIPKTDLVLSDVIMAEIVKEQQIKDAEIVE